MRLPPKGRYLAHAALLASQIVGLFEFAAPWRIIRGFPIDDAWIHQDVARSFARTGVLGYDGVRFGAGATSYLWAALLAFNYRFVHVDPVVYTLALNVSFYLASGQLLLAMALRDGVPLAPTQPRALAAAEAVAVVALACFGGNYLWFAYSGMEATLLVTLSLAAIAFVSPAPSRRPRARAIGAGVAAGVVALTRPETMALGPLLALVALRFGWKRRDAAVLLIPWSLAVGAYLGANAILAGTLLPATLGGRKWIWLGDYAGLPHGYMLWDFACTWVLRLRNYTLGTSSDIALWISFGLVVIAVARLVRSRNWGLLLASGWALVHLLIYAVLLPTLGHGGRYQPLLPLMYLVLVGLGAVTFLEGVHSEVCRLLEYDLTWIGHGVVLVTAMAPWMGLVAVGVRDWRRDNGKAVTHINATEIALGALVDRLPPEAKVASFDIGGIGFAAHRPILDLGGLSDAATARMLSTGSIWKYLRDQQVNFVAIPQEYDSAFPGPLNFTVRLHLAHNDAIHLTLLRTLETPPLLWFPAISATASSAPRQALYRVDFTGRPGPRAPTALGEPLPIVDPDGVLGNRARDLVTYDLRVLSGEGIRASIAILPTRDTEVSAPEDSWRVQFGPWGLRAQPPRSSPMTESFATARMLDQIEPYINVRDFSGGAQLVPDALVDLIADRLDPGLDPVLPTVPVPGGTTDSQRTLDALPAGVPLAAVVCGVAFWLDRRRRRPASHLPFGALDGGRPRTVNANAA